MSMRRREDLNRHFAESLQGVVRHVWEKHFTAAQANALFTTPVLVAEAPGPRKVIIPRLIIIEKPAGTAFTPGTAGPLNFGHGTNLATNIFATLALAGFVDQATAQSRALQMPDPTNAVAFAPITLRTDTTTVGNLGVYLRQATANMSGGASPLRVMLYGHIIPMDLTGSW